MVVVVGPSGVGKKMDRRWIEHEQPTVFKHVPSFTTRQPRPYESKGIDYIQVPKEQYDAMLSKGDLIENACFGLNCQAFSLAETKKQINLGYLPITDVNMEGALQIRDNMAKLPESERVPLLFFSIMTHWPEELKYNIYNRDFMTDEDKAARWAANQIEIKKIQKNIDEGFFSQVFYMDQSKKHPLKKKTKHRMPAYREFVQAINKFVGLDLPEPAKPIKQKSQEPLTIISPHKDISQYQANQIDTAQPDQWIRIPVHKKQLKDDISEDLQSSIVHNGNITSRVGKDDKGAFVEQVSWNEYVECMDNIKSCQLVLDMDLAEKLNQNDKFAHTLAIVPETQADTKSQFKDMAVPTEHVMYEVNKMNNASWLERSVFVGKLGDGVSADEFFNIVQSFYSDVLYTKTTQQIDFHVLLKRAQKHWFYDSDAIFV